MQLEVPISAGELIDKITILDIKLELINDAEKLKNIRREFEMLCYIRDQKIALSPKLDELTRDLREVNRIIWHSENDIRSFWNNDEAFLNASKVSHSKNDERARIKREINMVLKSDLVEEKSHATV